MAIWEISGNANQIDDANHKLWQATRTEASRRQSMQIYSVAVADTPIFHTSQSEKVIHRGQEAG